MLKGEQTVVVAHNNTIRGIIKMIKGLTDDEVMKIEVPNSIPLVFEFDTKFHLTAYQMLATKADQEK